MLFNILVFQRFCHEYLTSQSCMSVIFSIPPSQCFFGTTTPCTSLPFVERPEMAIDGWPIFLDLPTISFSFSWNRTMHYVQVGVGTSSLASIAALCHLWRNQPTKFSRRIANLREWFCLVGSTFHLVKWFLEIKKQL